MFGELIELAGDVLGTVTGIAIAPLSVSLGVSQAVIKQAIQAGCRTEREIREWVQR